MNMFKSIVLMLGLLCSVSGYASETAIYQCEDGERFEVAYPNDQMAILNYQGQLLLLNLAVSASGARYIGEGWQWWTKGETGNLAPLSKDEEYSQVAGKDCNPLKLVKKVTDLNTK